LFIARKCKDYTPKQEHLGKVWECYICLKMGLSLLKSDCIRIFVENIDMFDNLLGDLEAQQKKIAEKLKYIEVVVEKDGIKISGNARKEIENIEFSEDLWEDKEMFTDLMITVVNRFIEKAAEVEAKESQAIMESLLPPGFGDMFKQ
jgi:DNA-binding protein YbaB